jgi:hypothetical protein
MVDKLSNHMDNNPIQNQPDDQEIEELLSKFTPQPTSRFYIKMKSAPWQGQIPSQLPRSSINLKPHHKLIWGLAALGLACVILLIIIIPSARVAASQILHLFLSSSSNQLDVQVTLSRPGDLLDFSDPVNFTLSVADVKQQAGFGVKEISFLPEGLSFIGSRYDPSYNAVTLLYEAKNYKLFLTQRPLGNGEDLFSIGASANVKNVKVGNNDAEFVIGGWNAVTTQAISNNQNPTSTVNIYAVWENELPQSTLRWQADGIVYELRSDGEGSPTQSELINLANELK